MNILVLKGVFLSSHLLLIQFRKNNLFFKSPQPFISTESLEIIDNPILSIFSD